MCPKLVVIPSISQLIKGKRNALDSVITTYIYNCTERHTVQQHSQKRMVPHQMLQNTTQELVVRTAANTGISYTHCCHRYNKFVGN